MFNETYYETTVFEIRKKGGRSEIFQRADNVDNERSELTYMAFRTDLYERSELTYMKSF